MSAPALRLARPDGGMRPPTAVTLFSGIGSSSLALRNLGYSVLAHDIMPEAVDTLNANGFDAILGSVRDIDFKHPRYGGVEILVGGPPCQPFSQAHDGDGEYDPRDMIPDFIRAVRDIRPSVFIMEEVKTLTWKKHADYLERIEGDLRALGYEVEHRVLDSSRYGVGQARKRLFVIGVRHDVASTTWRSAWGGVLWPQGEETVPTMAETLGWTMDDAWARNRMCPEKAHVYEESDLNWVFERPAPTVVGSFRADVAAKPGWRKPGDGPRQNTLGSVSTTHTERLILQGLPKNWVVTGSKAKVDLQIGNSCPTPLLEALIDINIP